VEPTGSDAQPDEAASGSMKRVGPLRDRLKLRHAVARDCRLAADQAVRCRRRRGYRRYSSLGSRKTYETQQRAVVASDDGIWPMFYAVVARDRIEGVFTACTHLGRPPRLRRFYMFAIGGDAAASTSWTRGAVYALPRSGFRREWGHEWVSSDAVRPLLRLPVGPDDFPLRDTVVGLSSPEEFRRVSHHLRIAKRERAATMRGSILPFVRR
jgi:hypothetical protein